MNRWLLIAERKLLHYFHSAFSNHLSEKLKVSLVLNVAYLRFDCKKAIVYITRLYNEV